MREGEGESDRARERERKRSGVGGPERRQRAPHLRHGETHVPVYYTFTNLMKVPNEGPLICLVLGSTSIKPFHVLMSESFL